MGRGTEVTPEQSQRSPAAAAGTGAGDILQELLSSTSSERLPEPRALHQVCVAQKAVSARAVLSSFGSSCCEEQTLSPIQAVSPELQSTVIQGTCLDGHQLPFMPAGQQRRPAGLQVETPTTLGVKTKKPKRPNPQQQCLHLSALSSASGPSVCSQLIQPQPQPLPDLSCFILPLLALGSTGRKSLNQVISGSGFPLAAQSIVAVRVRSTTFSCGPMSMLGKPGGSWSSGVDNKGQGSHRCQGSVQQPKESTGHCPVHCKLKQRLPQMENTRLSKIGQLVHYGSLFQCPTRFLHLNAIFKTLWGIAE